MFDTLRVRYHVCRVFRIDGDFWSLLLSRYLNGTRSMEPSAPKFQRIAFDRFELDLRSGELRKNGHRVRLQSQPFRLLALMLERHGEVVTREEVCRELWHAGTFVDFDHSLGTAINKIREALGDSADHPQFVETLPRRGYRFIGEIAAQAQPPVPAEPSHRDTRPRWLAIAAAFLAILVCTLAVGFAYRWSWPRQASAPVTAHPFTALPGLEISPAFSPDGSRIAFAWNGDPESGSKGFDLYVKAIGSETLLRLTQHPSDWISPAWSPDGTQVAFHRIAGADTGVYVVPALGGPERKLRSTRIPFGISAPIRWSPDGKWIAFVDLLPPADSPRLHLLSLETLESKQISHVESCLAEGMPAFAHSGKQLAYLCLLKRQDNEAGIYSIAASGGPPMLVTRFMTGWGWPMGIVWTANDKKLILSRPQIGDDFELDEVTLAYGSLRKLSFGQGATSPAISDKGDKLAYTLSFHHDDIWRKDLLHPEAVAVKLIYSTHDQNGPQYSPDGKHIAFSSNRGGTWEIWMSDADGTHLVLMSDAKSSEAGVPRWSPDSQKLAFDSRQSGHPEVYIVDISERMPRKVVTKLSDMSTPSWSRDGKWLYFQSRPADTPNGRIFRCPASGGEAVALSAESGSYAWESYDGETVYFANRENAATLDLVSLKRAGAQSVLRGMPAVDDQSNWTVVPGGIYFVPADAAKSLQYFDFNSKQVRQIFEAEKYFNNGLSVSPDGRWILYTQIDELNADIMLVDHFN
jgi:Tol biopolymer transport system component/DNA-binding winged helix-turn-helix (wHTH) protein